MTSPLYVWKTMLHTQVMTIKKNLDEIITMIKEAVDLESKFEVSERGIGGVNVSDAMQCNIANCMSFLNDNFHPPIGFFSLLKFE